MTNKKIDEVFEAVQGPAPKDCATSCASPGTLTSVGGDVMERELRCSCTLELPDDGSVEYKSQWSDPGSDQLFLCLDVCTWSQPVSEVDEPDDEGRVKDESQWSDSGSAELFASLGACTWFQCVSEIDEDEEPYMNLNPDCDDMECDSIVECEPEICDGTEDVESDEIDEDDLRDLPQEPARPKRKKQRAPQAERLTTDQLVELVAMDKRLGLRGQLQGFIYAINSSGHAVDDPMDIAINYRCEWWEVERQRQALVLWQRGIGRALGFSSFRKYLASIPEVPEELRRGNGKFNRLVLVESRLGLKKLCHLAGVLYHCSDHQDPDSSVRWMRCQDGRRYRNKSAASVTQNIFADDEVGLSLFEGVCLYMQFPRVLCEEFSMFCTKGPQVGSDPNDATTLFISEIGPEAGWAFSSTRGKQMGAASKLRL